MGFHKGFSDNKKRTDALWLQKNGITAVLLLGEAAETVLFFSDQFIYICTYICTGCTVLQDPILQRKNRTHKLYYTLCYWHNEHNQYACTNWLQYVEVNTATINKEYTLLFNMISSSAVHITRTHSVTQCVSMECIKVRVEVGGWEG